MSILFLNEARSANARAIYAPMTLTTRENVGPWMFEVIDRMNDPTPWSVPEEQTLTVVSEIDMHQFPADAQEVINPYPIQGTAMLKQEGAPGAIMRPIDPIEMGPYDSVGVWVYVDQLSPDVATWSASDLYLRIGLFADYPSNTNGARLHVHRPFSSRTGMWQFIANPGGWETFGDGANVINGISLRILGSSTPNRFRVYWGPIVKIENRLPRGAIIFDFDDGYLSYYEHAYRYMTGKYGYRGAVHVVGRSIEAGVHPWYPSVLQQPTATVKQLLRMQDAGWDIGNHTWEHPSDGSPILNGFALKDLPYDMQERQIRRNLEWLWDNGFTFGTRVFAAPQDSINYKTDAILRHYHPIVRAGINANNPLPMFVRHYQGASYDRNETTTMETWRANLQFVQDKRIIRSQRFHNIGSGGYNPISIEKFEAFVDEVQNYDIDVITYSDVFDGAWPPAE